MINKTLYVYITEYATKYIIEYVYSEEFKLIILTIILTMSDIVLFSDFFKNDARSKTDRTN